MRRYTRLYVCACVGVTEFNEQTEESMTKQKKESKNSLIGLCQTWLNAEEEKTNRNIAKDFSWSPFVCLFEWTFQLCVHCNFALTAVYSCLIGYQIRRKASAGIPYISVEFSMNAEWLGSNRSTFKLIKKLRMIMIHEFSITKTTFVITVQFYEFH